MLADPSSATPAGRRLVVERRRPPAARAMSLGGDGTAFRAHQVGPADRVAAFLKLQVRGVPVSSRTLTVHRECLPDGRDPAPAALSGADAVLPIKHKPVIGENPGRSVIEAGQQARDVEPCRQVLDEEVIVQRPFRAAVTDEEDRVIDLVAKVNQRLHDYQARTVVA